MLTGMITSIDLVANVRRFLELYFKSGIALVAQPRREKKLFLVFTGKNFLLH